MIMTEDIYELMENEGSQRFTATHIAKSFKKSNARPKLVKECVCPNTRGTANLMVN